MAVGIALYVIYRRADETSLLRRVTVSPQRAARRAARRARLRLDPRAAVRHRPRRRHRADGRAARRGRADRRGRDRRRDDRGGVDVRDPDVAAARREPARGADQARAPGARAREGGGGGVQRRAGRDRDRAHPPRRLRDRRRGAPARRRGDRARRRGTVADPRRRPPRRPRRAARGIRGGRHQVRDAQGHLPGDRHGARRARLAERSWPAGPTGPAPQWSNLRTYVTSAQPHVRPDRRRRARRLGRRQVGARRRPRSVGARRGSALARAPRRRPEQELGGLRRPVHRRHGAGDRRADPGRDRARGRVHRLDRRRQHEPRDRPDRAEALRRREGDRARDGPRARRLVPRAGPADDLPDQARDRDVRARAHLAGGRR